MLLFILLSTFFSIASTAQVPKPFPEAQPPSLASATCHAASLFNALHGAMRQWESSLHHNGMSFFRATIPANTLFYHGTHTAEPVKGMEWLAFEIEHAEMFARTRGPGGGQPRPPPDEGGPGRGPPPLFDQDRDMGMEIQMERNGDGREPRGGELSCGYLHTYRTSRPLTNLLYLDGMSAGKTYMGTLDTQDLILLQDTNLTAFPGFEDYQRAVHLCALTPDIDGYIRMEAGFEIILCNFERGFEFVSAFQRPNVTDLERNGEGMMRAEFARGVGARYHGIGGGRVEVDHSSMISAFFQPLNLTNPDTSRPELPRLPKDDFEGLKKVKEDVLSLFSPETERSGKRVDWQGITDMIVTRYADRLAFLALNTSTETQMLLELDFLLRHTVDFKTVNFTEARETYTDALIYSAITSVTREICGTPFDIWELLHQNKDSARKSVEPERVKTEAKSRVGRLMHYLDWSTFLEWQVCLGRNFLDTEGIHMFRFQKRMGTTRVADKLGGTTLFAARNASLSSPPHWEIDAIKYSN